MATTICVDLLNYSDDFFNFPKMALMQTSDFEENLKYGRNKISEFVLAAQQSGYKIIGFIDKAIATGEALEKWFDRRTKQMESGHMNVFVKLPVIVGSIFSSLGVEVHYSTIDCDDTIAAFAHKVHIPNTMKTGPSKIDSNRHDETAMLHDFLSFGLFYKVLWHRNT